MCGSFKILIVNLIINDAENILHKQENMYHFKIRRLTGEIRK